MPRDKTGTAFAGGSILGAGWYMVSSSVLAGQVIPVCGAIVIAGLVPLLMTKNAMRRDAPRIVQPVAPRFAIEALHELRDDIWIVDVETEEFNYLNRVAKQRLDWNESDQEVRGFIDLPQDAGAQEIVRACRALKDSGEKSVEFETRFKDVPFATSVKRLQEGGQAGRFLVLLNDISDRLEQDRRKSDFISTVSHELRSPLTSIKGSMGILLSGTAVELPAKAIALLEIAHRNADRLVLIINDILDLEKISNGQMEFEMQNVDISYLIRETNDANANLKQRFALNIELVGVETSLMVQTDPNRVIQVLTNFLSNACKFSKPSGRIEIKLEDEGDQVRISVQDEGAGIPLGDQHKIFERFVDMENSDRAAKGGTGLGLSICQAIVEGLGGTIGFKTEVGVGSTFYFVVPKTAAVSGNIEDAVDLLEAV